MSGRLTPERLARIIQMVVFAEVADELEGHIKAIEEELSVVREHAQMYRCERREARAEVARLRDALRLIELETDIPQTEWLARIAREALEEA